jgi:dTDP-4-amino-4,6-dideoxy-D-galactose acyltransferase
MVKTLQWDSDFFKLKVGEINYDERYNQQDVSNYDLIYVISNDNFVLELDNFENTFSETKVIFVKNLEKENIDSEPIFKLNQVNVEIDKLYSLAFESGKNSRFLLDNRFDKSIFKNLYRAWIDNSINKKFADDILVYFEENQIKGFVSYKTIDSFTSVGLIAVDANCQGKGIGAKLLKYLENIILETGIKQITIPTQLSNIQACSFYKKQGYSIKKKTYIKHYWKI